jgi:hypothetical protein
MYVNLHENHFSFIKDISSFCHSFVCWKCSKIFSIPFRLTRHEQTCDVNVKHKFPGSTYQVPKNIFEEREEFEFEPRDKFFPYFVTWDIESFQFDISGNNDESRLQWAAEHVPASISVASNIPGYESANCFVTDGNSEQLVSEFLYSHTRYRLLHEKFENVFTQLDEIVRNFPENDDKGKEQMLKLKKKFDLFLKEMPVVGFNSSRYDVNVIKRFLFRLLESSEEDGISFVVKRNNAYMCIKTERLKFLDITNRPFPL